MCDDNDQTKSNPAEFDFSRYPFNTLFHERRTGRERRSRESSAPERTETSAPTVPEERRAKKDRRRRIDPTTFEKQYTADEMEFMNAMQRYKERTGKSFPTYAEVLEVAVSLGYRRAIYEPDDSENEVNEEEVCLVEPSTITAS